MQESKLFLERPDLALVRLQRRSTILRELLDMPRILLQRIVSLREQYKPLDQRTAVRNEGLHTQRERLDAERGCRTVRQWGVRRSRGSGRRIIEIVEALERAHVHIAEWHCVRSGPA